MWMIPDMQSNGDYSPIGMQNDNFCCSGDKDEENQLLVSNNNNNNNSNIQMDIGNDGGIELTDDNEGQQQKQEEETCEMNLSLVSVSSSSSSGAAGASTSLTKDQPPNARDTSTTSRCGLDNSRCVSVNTHNSILNITEDDDDEDEDEDDDIDIIAPILFDDLQDSSPPMMADPAPTPPILSPKRCCSESLIHTPTRKQRTDSKNSSLLEKVAEHFVDSLCFQAAPASKGLQLDLEDYRRLLESDIYELLGCSTSPDSDEMELWDSILSFYTSHKNVANQTNSANSSPAKEKPKRKTLRDRALRVHRIQSERALPTRSTGLSPTSVVPLQPFRTLSIDESTLFSTSSSLLPKPHHHYYASPALETIGFGMEPVLPDGYDSDPGETMTFFPLPPPLPTVLDLEQPFTTHNQQPAFILPKPSNVSSSHESDISAIQESFNLTWTLMWHPPNANPLCCLVWMERGTMVNNNHTMLEPQLMWRPAYQPKGRTLCTQTNSIRLLNLCRIRTTPTTLTDSLVARKSCCIVLKSESREFVFEACSPAERDDIVRRWKLTVARFATLAVMEDMESICQEFFSSAMIPEYDINQEF